MIMWRDKTDKQIVDYVLARQAEMVSRRTAYEPMYEMAIKLFQPRRYDLQQMTSKPRGHAKGDRYGVAVYDPHPARSLTKFATGLVGNMVSRSDNDPWWIRFVAPKAELMDIDRVKEALQGAEDQVKFGFNQSTFYRELPAFMADAGCTYATMTAQVDKVNDRIVFLTRHPADYWFTTDSLGQIVADHFKLEMTAWSLVEEFGKDALPKSIVAEVEGRRPNPFKQYDILHAIYPNRDRRGDSLDSTDKPYIQFYLLLNAGRSGSTKQLINKDGIDWRPLTLRLGATMGEDYPLSPALDALTSASYGNALSKDQLLLSQASANPPRRIHKNLRSQILNNRLNPGSNTYFERPEEGIEYLLQQGQYMISDNAIEKIARTTDEVFFVQFFEMLSGSADAPQRTAFEVSQMVSEKVTMMGPTVEASEDEVLEPASAIIWAYETQAGRMPEMPEELFVDGGGNVQNRYMGRLAQLRRTLREAKGSIEILQLLEMFASLFPSSLAKIKDRHFIEKTLIAHGADQDMFRSDEEMAEIDAQMAAKEAAAEEQAAIETMGKVLPPGKTIEENSPAELLGATS